MTISKRISWWSAHKAIHSGHPKGECHAGISSNVSGIEPRAMYVLCPFHVRTLEYVLSRVLKLLGGL